MPFRLGEGPRDWILPYAWDDGTEELASQAVADLCDLLAARRQLSDSAVPPQRHGLRRGGAPWEAEAAAAAVGLDPSLDPALFGAWIDRSAGKLGEALAATFRRALELELGDEARRPFAWLSILSTAPLAARVKAHAPRGLSYERLERAVGFGIFALVQAAAERAVDELGARPLPIDPTPSVERLRLSLNPLLYFSIRSLALQNDLNPWGLTEEIREAWDAKGSRLDPGQPFASLEQETRDRILGDARLRALFGAAGVRLRLRQALLDLGLEVDRGAEDGWASARAAVASNEALDAVRADPRAFLAKLQGGASLRPLGPLGALLGAGGSALEEVQPGVVALLAWQLDRLVADELDRLQRRLRDERAALARDELQKRYVQGQLYRLSGDGKPLLMTAESRRTGFLFVDLKGFTQRTVRSKEIAVADFLRREFYEPILTAARGLAPVNGEEFRLLNLLGDAAAFSGEIPALVMLAAEIRRICAAYERKLGSFDPGRSEALAGERAILESRRVAAEEPLLLERTLLEGELARKASLSADQRWVELERQVATRNAQLAAAYQGVVEKLPIAAASERPALEAEMLRLSAAQDDLVGNARRALERLQSLAEGARSSAVLELLTGRERARTQEIDRAIGQLREEISRGLSALARSERAASASELVAGVFISFGAAAEEIRLSDPVFGEVRVSVAEKLNEAARGTSRSAAVLAQVEAALLAEAVHRGATSSRSPFAVHLERPEAGKVAGEIYNGGQALSGEALDAFLRGTLDSRIHFARALDRGELGEEAVATLALPERVSLILSLPAAGAIADVLGFRRIGRVAFKGFEEGEGCDVYELLPADGPLMQLVVRLLLPRWVQEAKSNPAQLLSGLPQPR